MFARVELVRVQWSDRSTIVPCPSAIGALVAKAAAANETNESMSLRMRHFQDVLSLARVALTQQSNDSVQTAKDRMRIRKVLHRLTTDKRLAVSVDARDDDLDALAELLGE